MYNPKNIKEGQLNKPSLLSYEDAAGLCSELGFFMPPEHLLAYLSYSSSRKSISYDELYILDSLYVNDGAPAAKSFKTDSAFLFESYSDLVNKNIAINGADAPITVESMLNTPDSFIAKYTGNVQSTRQSTYSSRLSLYCQGCIDSSKSPTFTLDDDNTFGIYGRKDRKRAPVLDRSIIFALLPREGLTHDEYDDEAVKALSLLENSELIYNPFVIGTRGLVQDIINFNLGASINTASYPSNPACKTFASTLSALAGYGAFFITERHREQLMSALSDTKLVAIECARVNNEGFIAVFSGKKLIADMDTYYLKNANSYKYFDIIAHPSEDNTCKSDVELSSVKGRDSLIQKHQLGTYTNKNIAVSYAKCRITSNSVHNGTYTALLPIFELAAKGVDRRHITISKRLELNLASDISDAVSTVVALSRSQIELSVMGESNSLNYSAHSNMLHLFATGRISVADIPSDHFVQDGNGIYILSPMRRDSDAPNFENIRKLLDYLYAIIRKGIVKSVKVFYNTPLDKAVGSMETNGTGATTRSLDGIVCPPLYLLVEATEGIGGTHIGETYIRDFHPVLNVPDAFEKSNIKTRNPNVLVLSFNDKMPRLKTVLKNLSLKGAKVKFIKATLEKKCLDYIVSVLPQTHIILICGDDELITNAICDINLRGALARYKEEKKLIVAFGEGAVSALSDLQYLPATYAPISEPTCATQDIDLYSKNIPSAFSMKKISYRARVQSIQKLISGDSESALVCASINGEIYSDGLISSDGLTIGVYSLLCDEIIESAIKYYEEDI